ncbi:MAG: sulfotransferase domain-containing protein [Nocardioides sp.]|uniref:sulfotransferase domain-containing protein n=1 Tax=Nocardioides sp. TaxID=35761 RepID=UPI0039E3C419
MIPASPASPGRWVRSTLRGPVRTRVRRWQDAHRLPPDGRASGLPDFVGIGAQRCGTSWWHSLLEQHPEVAGLGWGAKELHFFDDCWGVRDDRELAAAYAAQFRRRPGQLAGEWTPRYLYDPWAVPSLLRIAPQVRLMVMLRDPVARFVSGIQHEVKLAGGRPRPDAVTGAYQRGLYAAQLRPLLELVDRRRLLVLQLERCRADPDAWLQHTFAFLGLDPHHPRGAGERNRSRPAQPVEERLLAAVRPGYRRDAAELAALFPDDIDLGLWPGLTS